MELPERGLEFFVPMIEMFGQKYVSFSVRKCAFVMG
jgi:hypothetical protein